MHPGCKVDTILVLAGNQGFLKSTFFAELAGEWFGDSPIDLQNKDGYLVLHQSWITELGEIDHLTSVQSQEKVKAFLSSRKDIFRAPYAASASTFPRSGVIVGTTNRDNFLTDSTGSRRFWPFKVTAAIDIALLREWKDQLWAEARALEAAGVEHWLESSMDTRRETQAEDFAAEDPWEHMVKEAEAAHVKAGRFPSDGIPIAELMTLMGLPAAQQTKGASMKLAGLLRAMGWEQFRHGENRERRWRRAS
jgi:putative DNA primase/helicase